MFKFTFRPTVQDCYSEWRPPSPTTFASASVRPIKLAIPRSRPPTETGPGAANYDSHICTVPVFHLSNSGRRIVLLYPTTNLSLFPTAYFCFFSRLPYVNALTLTQYRRFNTDKVHSKEKSITYNAYRSRRPSYTIPHSLPWHIHSTLLARLGTCFEGCLANTDDTGEWWTSSSVVWG